MAAKHSLSFILDIGHLEKEDAANSATPAPSIAASTDEDLALQSTEPVQLRSAEHSVPRISTTGRRRRQRPMTAEDKRLARQCSVDGCPNYTIDRGLCFRHGGGKTCSVDDCDRSAKARGLCWRHGGSVICTVPGCTRGAKSRGLCWSHGGGTKCSVNGCEKTTISKGLCWTHGGGKRCSYDGCKRPASESKHNFCSRHHANLSEGEVVVEV